ncbi:MAG: hypothetical protein KDA93_24185 [Planctomycetaceae bacterium]|nr:hypothetical protein [Planctomycetaceae bacterium]
METFRMIASGLLAVMGTLAGGATAFFATFYACRLIDYLQDASPGGGFVAVGWLFLPITILVGGCIGGCIGFALPSAFFNEDDGEDS